MFPVVLPTMMVVSTAAGLAMPHPALFCTATTPPSPVVTGGPLSDAVMPLEAPDPDC